MWHKYHPWGDNVSRAISRSKVKVTRFVQIFAVRARVSLVDHQTTISSYGCNHLSMLGLKLMSVNGAGSNGPCREHEQMTLTHNEGGFNSLRPSDAIWRQWSWTTLAQVMACCLTAPSLNQCWLIIRGVLWHTSESSFAGIAQGIDSGYEFEKDILKNIFKSPRGQWVKRTLRCLECNVAEGSLQYLSFFSPSQWRWGDTGMTLSIRASHLTSALWPGERQKLRLSDCGPFVCNSFNVWTNVDLLPEICGIHPRIIWQVFMNLLRNVFRYYYFKIITFLRHLWVN